MLTTDDGAAAAETVDAGMKGVLLTSALVRLSFYCTGIRERNATAVSS
jgi:hypothetical protein